MSDLALYFRGEIKAGARQLAEMALYLVLHYKSGSSRRDVQEAIHAITGEGREGRCQFGILVGKIVGWTTALIEGRMIGWSTGCSTTSLIR